MFIFVAKAIETDNMVSYSVTKYVVLEPLNSKLVNGEVVEVKQEKNFCHRHIELERVYKIKYMPQGELLRGSFCSIKNEKPINQ